MVYLLHLAEYTTAISWLTLERNNNMRKKNMILFLLFFVTSITAQPVANNKLQEILCSYEEYVDVIMLTRGLENLTQDQQKMIKEQYEKLKEYDKRLIEKANKLGVTVTNQEMKKVLDDGTEPILKQTHR